ncbi:beta-1,4-N-acetylgalactosaminyltransferase bre-4-like [Battus philenor]|uniref:beta-1,4-N-acetylgalactosaminyltransferase bre-4-like n=1 Tax=Battus philenor TaxID=42288 RepID=UPI0035D0BBC7
MSKWKSMSRILQLRITTCIIIVLCLVAVIQFFASYGEYNYEHIPRDKIMSNIYFKTNPNLEVRPDKPKCNYNGILQSTATSPPWTTVKSSNGFSLAGIVNGSYIPEDCNPLLSVAILVTYRLRQSQLDIFIPYIHNFLRKQGIHYSIYVIEQQDNKMWNKGLLYNVGVKQAIADKFPCLILHDVDILPLDTANLYACLQEPRHMSASLDKFRYVLTYNYLIGGAVAIRSDQYMAINGFSNKFQGWGGEDDDFAMRIAASKLKILRFPPDMSRYTMMHHIPQTKNTERTQIMKESKNKFLEEGYNSAEYSKKIIQKNQMFTLIGVKT